VQNPTVLARVPKIRQKVYIQNFFWGGIFLEFSTALFGFIKVFGSFLLSLLF